MNEEMLIQQIADGNMKAFGKLVERYQHRIVRFAERMLGDEDAAQDIAQETFLRLWRARARYPEQNDPVCYLLRIARNLCLDTLRSHHATETLDEMTEIPPVAEASMAASLHSKTLAERVRRSVQALPEPQRVVFILSYYEDLSYKEIAEVVGCPIGTVASRKYQAVETLRRRLKPWIEGDALQ